MKSTTVRAHFFYSDKTTRGTRKTGTIHRSPSVQVGRIDVLNGSARVVRIRRISAEMIVTFREQAPGRPYALEATDADGESVLIVNIFTISYGENPWTHAGRQCALARSIFVDCVVDSRVRAGTDVKLRWIYSHNSGRIQNRPATDFTYEQRN